MVVGVQVKSEVSFPDRRTPITEEDASEVSKASTSLDAIVQVVPSKAKTGLFLATTLETPLKGVPGVTCPSVISREESMSHRPNDLRSYSVCSQDGLHGLT